MLQTSLLLLSIVLIFFAVAELCAAIVCFALYRRITSTHLLEERIVVLEQSYRNLRAAKANAARKVKNQPFQPGPEFTEDDSAADAQYLRDLIAAGGE